MSSSPRPLRVGGSYRYVWRNADGAEMGMGGVCTEIVPPERVAWTEAFDEAWYPGEALVTYTLDDVEGTTVLTLTLRYESGDARDGVLQTPMESGLTPSFNRLAELLESESR